MPLTAADFRQAMGSFATGVTIITVDQDGEVHGMTANAFTSVSLDPMLVLVCVDHRARTHAHLHARKRFGVNVLSSGQQAISIAWKPLSAPHCAACSSVLPGNAAVKKPSFMALTP